MLEIMEFVFRDLWTFVGVIILVYVIGVYCVTAPLAIVFTFFTRKKKK